VRAVLEAAGVTDILTKVLGTHNPHNVIKATLEGLRSLKSPEQLAKRRGLPVDQVTA
jgi:small subunit ribosomal protein S5